MKTNQVKITGFTGRDIEVITTNEKTRAKFSVAVDSSYKVGGEWNKKTNWFNVIVWGEKRALELQEVKKGTKVTVEGSLNISDYNGRQLIEIVATAVTPQA